MEEQWVMQMGGSTKTKVKDLSKKTYKPTDGSS